MNTTLQSRPARRQRANRALAQGELYAIQPVKTLSVVAQLAALKDAPTPALKAKWRELFDTEPPPYNRRFLESRLAYRIQELAYGGLKPQTLARLKELGKCPSSGFLRPLAA